MPSGRLLSLGLVTAVLAVVVQTACHLTNGLLLDNSVAQLDANREQNTFTWASSVATFTSALAAVGLAVVCPAQGRRLGVLAALLVFFSLDDSIELHERLNGILGQAWPVLALPLLVLAFALIWDISRRVSARQRRFLRAGLILLVVAVLAEAVQRFWLIDRYDPESWPFVLDTGSEEGAELAGWILVAAALISAHTRAVTNRAATRARLS